MQPEELREFLERLRERIPVEALILFGSHARGGAGEWSDVDVLVVSDYFKGLTVPERLAILLELKRGRVEPLGYTYEELVKMVRRANPLALSALVEGVFLIWSPRVAELASVARRSYTRRGRVWVPRGRSSVDGA